MRRAALITFLVGCGGSESIADGPSAAFYDIVVDATGVSGTLIVQDNGVDDLTIQATGSFTFHARIKDGASYDVTIKTQPAGQSCELANAMGIVQSAEVHVAITCTPNTYRIGGHLTGVIGTVQLTNNGGDPLSLSADGDFFFATRVAYQTAYAVAIGMQPAASTCVVSMGSGTVPDADVTDVAVDCAP